LALALGAGFDGVEFVDWLDLDEVEVGAADLTDGVIEGEEALSGCRIDGELPEEPSEELLGWEVGLFPLFKLVDGELGWLYPPKKLPLKPLLE